MNKERLKLLADRLYHTPKKNFDMELYCGTACCIAGHAAILSGYYDRSDVHAVAADWLGLSEKNSRQLFTPNFKPPYRKGPRVASGVIRHLIKTGKVEWERFV